MNRCPCKLIVVGMLVFLKAPAVRGSTVPEFDRATQAAMKEDYASALHAYESLIARAPQDRLAPVAAMAAASLQLRTLHDTTAAEGWLDRVVRDYPASGLAAQAARSHAEVHAARKEWAGAGDAYTQALQFALHESPPPASAWMRDVTLAAGDCYFQAGDKPKVIETYRKAIASSPPPDVAATALFRLGRTLESTEDMDGAAEAYAQILQSYPSAEQFNDALSKRALIEPRAKVDWKSCETYASGSRMVARQDLDGALRNADSVLAMTDNPALQECAEYRKITCETWISHDLAGGCARLRTYLEAHPNGLRAEMARTTIERWAPAADLQADAQAHPNDPETLRSLGSAYLQMRQGSWAIEPAEKAVTLDPDNEDGHLILGYAYTFGHRAEDARKEFLIYLKNHADDVTVLNLIGYSFLGAGQAEQAIPYFERCAAIAPDDPNVHDSLGEGYLGAGRLEEAAREYERALAIEPSFSNSIFMVGGVYRRMGQIDKARAAYTRFLDLGISGQQADEARAALNEMGKP